MYQLKCGYPIGEDRIMAKIKNQQILDEEIDELSNLALKNKSHLKFKKVRFTVDDVEYEFIIRGIGKKTVKFEVYVDYERILNHKDDGVIEKQLWDKINTIYHKEPKQRLGKQ